MQTLKKIETILDNIAAENRWTLTEPEVYEIFTGLGLNLPQYLYFAMRDVMEIHSMLAGLAEKLPGRKNRAENCFFKNSAQNRFRRNHGSSETESPC